MDVGVRCGFALYDRQGLLRGTWSRNLGHRSRLKPAVSAFLRELPELTHLVLEGGRNLGLTWEREGTRRGLQVVTISAETWRGRLLIPRERRSGKQAKRTAEKLARETMRWAGLSPPSSFTTDLAEAVLIGLWAVLELGWLEQPPTFAS